MWWVLNSVAYCKDNDMTRMKNNVMSTSMEIPDMKLLIKDHKTWSVNSDKPVPSRPVVSGSRGVNTHMSEWLSEFLEPIAKEFTGGEDRRGPVCL